MGAYLTFKSIFHKTLNLFQFDCDITLNETTRGLWWSSNPRPPHYASDVQRNNHVFNNVEVLIR